MLIALKKEPALALASEPGRFLSTFVFINFVNNAATLDQV